MPSDAYPLRALRELLGPQAPSRGIVTRVTGGEVQVATSSGLVTARASGLLAVGQAVSLSGGVAKRRAVTSAEYPL